MDGGLRGYRSGTIEILHTTMQSNGISRTSRRREGVGALLIGTLPDALAHLTRLDEVEGSSKRLYSS